MAPFPPTQTPSSDLLQTSCIAVHPHCSGSGDSVAENGKVNYSCPCFAHFCGLMEHRRIKFVAKMVTAS